MNLEGRLIAGLCLACCLVLWLNPAEAAVRKGKYDRTPKAAPEEPNKSILPQKGDVAILVEGAEEPHIRVAEAMIIDALTRRGYRVVDEAKMKKIRMAAAYQRAAQLALKGNVKAVLRVNGRYSVGATIVAHITADPPRENPFGLYTGTASATILAVRSNGVKLGGRTADSKQVGYTEGETQRKSIKAAVEAGLEQVFKNEE